MKDCFDCEEIKKRISRITGQLNGINKMVEEEKPCEDILIQINAVKSAVHKVGQIILEGHLRHCVLDGIQNGDPEKTISEFAKAVEHFSRLG